MQAAKKKVNDAAASAKEHVDILKAKAEKKADKTTASSKEDKEMAKEQSKAKEAEAKVRKHEAKADNAAGSLQEKQHGHQGEGEVPGMMQQGNNQPTGATVPLAHAAAPGQPQYDPNVPPTNAAPPTQEPLGGAGQHTGP